jgi:hypothetical protein
MGVGSMPAQYECELHGFQSPQCYFCIVVTSGNANKLTSHSPSESITFSYSKQKADEETV